MSSVQFFAIEGSTVEGNMKNSGLYYKPMMIINDDSRVINKLETPLPDDARVAINDCHMFILLATGIKMV